MPLYFVWKALKRLFTNIVAQILILYNDKIRCLVCDSDLRVKREQSLFTLSSDEFWKGFIPKQTYNSNEKYNDKSF